MTGGRARGLATGRRHVVNDHTNRLGVVVVVHVLERHLGGSPLRLAVLAAVVVLAAAADLEQNAGAKEDKALRGDRVRRRPDQEREKRFGLDSGARELEAAAPESSSVESREGGGKG